ncbi:MAG: prepilin-type N-terminal cleavage/methylation domain-containing protein [Betaproteobacteria bacterium]|nr:MAG: prepilin-type N-terminal cleavage/methylation domain-containing protein [Betaproteobacteria bacterium]TMH79462.1 MAG: prepilin-type N-terminal cleavage/methylation domain-containing protein [Betaproteobacteria bacterium]
MQRPNGFTLIELMVTVAIIAILAAIAIPNYSDYVRRGKLQEATSNLLAMRTKMEQYFQDNRSYTTPGAPVLAPCIAGSSVPIPALKYFTITCPVLTATQYTIQADGTDATLVGITYTINEGNGRATAVAPGSPMDQAGYTNNLNCWTIRKGGQC